MRILATLAGGLVGGVAGYFIGVVMACDWLYPTSNLCGIYGVFFTGRGPVILRSVRRWPALDHLR